MRAACGCCILSPMTTTTTSPHGPEDAPPQAPPAADDATPLDLKASPRTPRTAPRTASPRAKTANERGSKRETPPRADPTSTPPVRAIGYRDRVIGLVRADPSRLLDHPDNWRIHPDAQATFLRGVLGDVGIAGVALAFIADDAARRAVSRLKKPEARQAWLDAYTGPLMLTDGHLRKKTITQPIPTVVLDLTPEEARRALATHDTAGGMAETDVAKLRAIVEGSGFEGDVLARLRAVVGPEARPIDDDEEEPVIPTDALVAKWQTAPGQLWVVPSLTVPGREHRLLCGDCRDPANVERLHEGARPDLGLHDPPYGIDIVSDTGVGSGKVVGEGNRRVRRNKFEPIAGDRRGTVGGAKPFGTAHGAPIKATTYAPVEGDDEPFDPAHLLAAFRRLVLWGANNYADRLPPSPGVIVWDKRVETASNNFSDGEIAWVSPILSRSLRFIRHLWNGLCRASEIGEKRLHPTQKPIVVQRQIVEWYTKPGDLVADWYMGAGAVIIACEQTGRVGHGMDIAPAYLAATLERLAARGLTPRLVQ